MSESASDPISASAVQVVAPARVKRAPLWLLALITFSGTMAMHVFVPALPQAATDLGASANAMQLTVSFYIAGLAIGQLIYGPVSDHFGRRPVLIVGLVVYALAGFGAAFAPNVDALIAARLFQSLGGCAGLVLGRAIVRDGSTTADAAKRLALMNLMVTVGPGMAPLIGGALVTTTGWRSILLALCVLGAVNLLLTWRLLPETSGGSGHVHARCSEITAISSLHGPSWPTRSAEVAPPHPSTPLSAQLLSYLSLSYIAQDMRLAFT
jgi:DHA1 family bicyclomycin/chloramphenicol resistance-like MFS transporter